MKLLQVLIILLSLTAIFTRKSHSKDIIGEIKKALTGSSLKEDVEKAEIMKKTDMDLCKHVADYVDPRLKLAKSNCKMNCIGQGANIGKNLRTYIPLAIARSDADKTKKYDFVLELAEMIGEKMNFYACGRRRHRKH